MSEPLRIALAGLGTVGGGLVGEVFEHFEVVAVAGVQHDGAVGSGAPGDFFGETEGGAIKREGAVPVAGFEADVVEAGDECAHGCELKAGRLSWKQKPRNART